MITQKSPRSFRPWHRAASAAIALRLLGVGVLALPLCSHAQWTQNVVYSGGGLTPAGIASDANGNLFFVDTSSSSINRVPAGGGSAVSVATGLSSPQSVAWAPQGGSDFTLVYGQSGSVTARSNIGGSFQSPTTIASSGASGVAIAALTSG